MTLTVDSTVYLFLDAVMYHHYTEESFFSPVAQWYQRWVELVQLATIGGELLIEYFLTASPLVQHKESLNVKLELNLHGPHSTHSTSECMMLIQVTLDSNFNTLICCHLLN